jgi:microcin C transport system substrate-binding protein
MTVFRYGTLFVAVLAFVASAFLTTGCGRKAKSTSSEIKNTWKKYDTPPGADPSVPDTLGGAGFENVAERMGFATYVVKDEDLKYFGDSRAVKGGEITIGEMTFPTTFRPEGQGSSLTVNTEMKGYIYETLLSQHPVTREYMPGLASHWKVSPDKKTFTFRIDPNARWADGKPVVAQDVVTSWKLMVDPGILEPSANLVYEKFEPPVALSKYIVQVTCKTVNFRNLLYFGNSLVIYPDHEIGNITGKEFLDKYNFNMPVGTGPYIINEKDIKAGNSWRLTRRPDYWGKDYPTSKYTANFDYVNYLVVKDNANLLYEKFKAGDIDLFRFSMATTEKWIKDTDYEAIKNGWVRRFRFYTNGPMGTNGITFNMRRAPFDDIRVRKAFMMVYPRETLIEKLLYNEYETYDTDYPNTPYASKTNPKMKYDPAAAAKLLAEAGWTSRNSEGILMKNGKPFVLEMAITKLEERWMTPYQQELKNIGVDLRLKLMDWNSIIKNIDERNFQIFAYGYSGLVTPNPETSLQSSLADKNDNNNIQGFKNARVDELLPIYDTTFSVAGQIKIINEIDKLAYDSYMKSHWWNPKGIRLAVWDKFGMPEYGIGRYAQLSFVYGTAALTWWYDAEKASALAEAKKSKKDLGGEKGILEYRYWREYSESK